MKLREIFTNKKALEKFFIKMYFQIFSVVSLSEVLKRETLEKGRKRPKVETFRNFKHQKLPRVSNLHDLTVKKKLFYKLNLLLTLYFKRFHYQGKFCNFKSLNGNNLWTNWPLKNNFC